MTGAAVFWSLLIEAEGLLADLVRIGSGRDESAGLMGAVVGKMGEAVSTRLKNEGIAGDLRQQHRIWSPARGPD